MIGVSKREDIFKNKGYFQKFLAPYNDARAQCQCGRSNILEEVDYNIFLTLNGCLIQIFVSVEF